MSIGNFYRKLEKVIGLNCKMLKRHIVNRAKFNLPKYPSHQPPNGLIYGQQGSVFNNHVEPKAWQHGPNYDKPHLSGYYPVIDKNRLTYSDGSTYRIDNNGALVSVPPRIKLNKRQKRQAKRARRLEKYWKSLGGGN